MPFSGPFTQLDPGVESRVVRKEEEMPTKKPEKKPIEIWVRVSEHYHILVSGDGEWRWEVLRKLEGSALEEYMKRFEEVPA